MKRASWMQSEAPRPGGFRKCASFMTQKNGNAGNKIASDTRQTGKKPYQKPTFRHERVFETMALSCGKISPTQFQCRFNRKTS